MDATPLTSSNELRASSSYTPQQHQLSSARQAARDRRDGAKTNAVNRSWSDVDPLALVGTFGLTSFTSSVVLHPFYLLSARQQCQHEEQSVSSITRSIWRKQGIRGLYRGVGVSTFGTVLSECLYFVVIEKAKEALPISSKQGRDFGAGLAADGISGPLYVPFAIISQRQMVGDAMLTPPSASAASAASNTHPSRSYKGAAIAREIVEKDGWRALFRGTVLSLAMMPVSGCWWVVYESLKGRAYAALATPEEADVTRSASPARGEPSSVALALSSPSQATSKPAPLTGHRGFLTSSLDAQPSASWRAMLTSRTDNPLVNAGVGAVTGGFISGVLNPLFVVRTRLQVLDAPAPVTGSEAKSAAAPASRWRAAAVAKDVYAREGVRGFARGLRVNVLMGIGGSMLFGTFYEGAKRVADVSE